MATDISFFDGSFKRPLHTSPNSPVRMQKNEPQQQQQQHELSFQEINRKEERWSFISPHIFTISSARVTFLFVQV